MMNEYTYEARHMGTDVVLSFVCHDEQTANTIARDCFGQIHAAELEFSRFLPNSSLSQLNTNRSHIVSPLFLEVLQTTLSLYDLTSGVFNPLVQVATLGYTTSFKDVPSMTTLSDLAYNTDLYTISIQKDASLVTLQAGQQLDFGGVLKGFLASRLAEYISYTYPDCHGSIINIGGDIATRGLDALHEPFIFMLYNPITDEETSTTLTNTSLATIGTYARHWHTSHGTKHHIVDARTHDNPTHDIVSVSIIHPAGAVAEALTKLFIINGVDDATAVLQKQNLSYQYFCVARDGSTTSSRNL